MTTTTNYTEWIDGKPVHPVASLFPMMSKADLNALAEDIKGNGLRESIRLGYADWQAKEEVVIDGRNRHAACLIAGVEPRFFVDEGLTPEHIGPWILSHNMTRRHLTVSQRAVVALEFERAIAEEMKARYRQQEQHVNEVKAHPEQYPHLNAEDESIENTPGPNSARRSAEEAAKLCQVGKSSVKDAKYVAENDPDLLELVRQGHVKVSAAARQLREKNKADLNADELKARQSQKMDRAVQNIMKNGGEFAAGVIERLQVAINDQGEADNE